MRRRHEAIISHLVSQRLIILVTDAHCCRGVSVSDYPTEWYLVEDSERLVGTTATGDDDHINGCILVEGCNTAHQVFEGIRALNTGVVDLDINLGVAVVDCSDGINSGIAVSRCYGSARRKPRLLVVRTTY
jgi:hypothetical protein